MGVGVGRGGQVRELPQDRMTLQSNLPVPPKPLAEVKPGPLPKSPRAAQIIELTPVRGVLPSLSHHGKWRSFQGSSLMAQFTIPAQGSKPFELAKEISCGGGEGGKGGG